MSVNLRHFALISIFLCTAIFAAPAAAECTSPLQGDINNDCIVDINDLAILSDEWLWQSNLIIPQSGQNFHFTVTADPRGYHTVFGNVCQAINNILGGTGAFHISVGDIDEQIWENRAKIDTYFGASAIWYPVIGNHEAETGIDMEWLRNEYNNGNSIRTPLKNYTNQDGPTGTVRTNYSWDYGNAHFVVLNEYWDGGINEGTGQSISGSDTAVDGDIVPALYNWLVADLATCSKSFIFAFGHEPAFPYNRHVGDSLDANETSRNAFWNLLETQGVAAFICGHTHYYSSHSGDVNHVGKVLQLDVGNAGNDQGDGKTFFNVIVSDSSATIDVYRDTGTGTFSKVDSFEFIPRHCSPYLRSNLDDDCDIDLIDFAILASDWLQCNRNPPETCP